MRALACVTVLALFTVGTFVGPAAAAAPLPYVYVLDKVSAEPAVGQPGYLDFPIRVSAPSEETVSVDYRTVDGTARRGLDYVARVGTVVLLPGTTTKTLRIRLKSDDVAEVDEAFTLVLSNPVNAQLDVPPDGTGTITDVGDPLVLTLSRSDPYLEPDAGMRVNVFLELKLNRPAPPGVSFELTYVDGTAVARQDYSPGAELKTFTVGRQNDRVQMTIKGDDLPEDTETFSVTVTADGATVANDSITITILDND